MSETLNSNSINIVAGLAVPAALGALVAFPGLAVFDLAWLVGMTAAALVLFGKRGGAAGVLPGALLIVLYAVFLAVQFAKLAESRTSAGWPERGLLGRDDAAAARPGGEGGDEARSDGEGERLVEAAPERSRNQMREEARPLIAAALCAGSRASTCGPSSFCAGL